MLIILCLCLSAILRVGSQGMAFAKGSTEIFAKDMAPQTCPEPAPPDAGSLLAAIKERQDQLTNKEVAISERLQILNAVEARVAQDLEVLRAAEAQLASTLAIADSAAEKDLARLTEVYERMKPKNAALVFETMEMSFAAGFLSRMKPEFAAGILSEMPAEMAYSVSVVMAGRNARAPVN